MNIFGARISANASFECNALSDGWLETTQRCVLSGFFPMA